MGRVSRLAVGVLAALALAGCGGGGGAPGGDAAPVPGGGYFVGSGAGLGAAVDFSAEGAGVRALRRELGPGRAAAVAAVVNRGTRAARMPAFRAVLAGEVERRVGLVARPRGGPGAAPPARLAARGARTIHLILPRGVEPSQVSEVEMVPAGGPPVRLPARRR